jgi:cysteinyl-tRNA synthetase
VAQSKPVYVTNTLGRELQEFVPIDPPRVRLYTCGPTVYSFVHIGNFRAYIFADMLRRTLDYNGFQVRHIRNVTDVGHLTNETLNTGLDRIEATARAENMSPWDVSRHYTEIFLRDAHKLNLLEPDEQPRATEYVSDMIALTQRLIEEGHAYQSNGDVYYNVDTFPTYGALSGNSVEALIAGARVEVSEAKRSPADFALWRAADPEKLMRWDSPWSSGVPGWHIECSAMSMKLLGEQIDIHTGGVDNIFPHHEDERAQSEAATGTAFVRYWMHNELLVIGDNEKMSKSLGNIYTISDLQERGIHPLAYRYFICQAHYRTRQNFTMEALEAAQTGLVRLWEQAAQLSQAASLEPLSSEAETFRDKFHEAINRDLDLPRAVATVHDAVATSLPPGQKLSLLQDVDRVLALDLLPMAGALSRIEDTERALLDQRQAARKRKDWAESDRIRQELSGGGLNVKDTPQGQRWIRRDVLNGSRA